MKGMIIALVLGMFLLSACTPAETPNTNTPVKIGVIAPLTGDLASIGQGITNAAVLAVEDINANAGPNDIRFEIISEDGHCNSKDGANAGNKLINLDGADYLIVSCSPEVLAVAPMAQENHVVVISPVSSAPVVSDAGDYVFRDYPSDSFVAPFLAQYMHDELGLRNVAVLGCLNDYCEGIVSSFTPAFEAYDGTSIVATERFNNDARDLRTQLSQIKEANPDGILFIAFTESAIVGLKQMEELGLDVPVLGADAYDDTRILTESGAAGNGLRYAIPYTPDAPAFAQRYQERFGTAPAAGTPQSYDAVMILRNVMQSGATTPEAVKSALYAMPAYSGVSGTIAFDEKGDLKGAAYLVKEYRNGAAIPIQTYIGGKLEPVEG